MSDLLNKVEPIAVEMRKRFMEGLESHPYSKHIQWSDLAEEKTYLEKDLEKNNAWRIEDEPGAIYLKSACFLLSVYRSLLPHFKERKHLLDLLRDVIRETVFGKDIADFLKTRLGISSNEPEKAWDQICSTFYERGQQQYGKAWQYEEGIRDGKRYFVNIRKCLFSDFFLTNDARELLYILCASDYVWGDALQAYNIRFERPTTLSEGGDACRFQFFKEK